MEFIDWIVAIDQSNIFLRILIIPFCLCAILFFFFDKEDEFGENGLKNIGATLMLVGFNFTVVLTFYHEINELMQQGYNLLGIPTLNPEIWDNFPLWAIIFIGIAAKDFADYWNHRIMHTPWFWPTHAAHHSDTHVNAFTTYRVHFLEAFVMVASHIILLTWLQIPEAIPIVSTISRLHNHYVHMNLPIDHGPFRLLLASPLFHRWHHADVPEAYGKNLANVMPVWDKIFGTYYLPGPCNEPMGALKTGVEDTNPAKIITYPFREWHRMISEHFKGLRDKANSKARHDP